MKARYQHVALLSPPYSTLTYMQPDFLPARAWAVGMRVLVPLGSGSVRVGIVLDAGQESHDLPAGIQPKNMCWPLDSQPFLTVEYLQMIRHLAVRQAVQEGQILGTILPLALRSVQVKIRHFLAGKPRLHSVRELARMPRHDPEEFVLLCTAWKEGQADCIVPREDAATGEECILLVDAPFPVRPSAHRQRAVLEYLHEHGASPRRSLLNALGADTGSALNTLIKNSLVGVRPVDAGCEADDLEQKQAQLLPPASPPFVLSEAQQAACAALKASLLQGNETHAACTHLLYGVTGSGKTAVYLEFARFCLEQGRSLVLLAPEVALALKLKRDVQNSLAQAPLFFFHGYQSAKRRQHTFSALAKRTDPCIIVGTRSALFLPVPALGAIVLDEEHDSSYKQDEGLVYQAKDVAWYQVQQASGVLVLGSATPDVKTFKAVQEGLIQMSQLPDRVGGGTLPAIELVKMLSAPKTLLEPRTREALQTAVQAGNQAVVLLNRRGYAPLMYCLDCGTVARCPHCDIGLAYHKGRERLICHYCGYQLAFPCLCSKCKGVHFLPMGEGTEHVEEYLSTLLGDVQILRLDRDSTRRPGSMEEILQAFARQEAQVLVGTQMLSKGHHFPNVTLAVVADGDIGLNMPDYRATERTFQLLVQSAGRAGRGEKPGLVLIQTRDVHHACWDCIRAGDYEHFYAQEIALRERRKYPPFVRLALVRMSFELTWEGGAPLITSLGTILRTLGRDHDVQVLGPVPSPLPMLRGRKRFQCILKAEDWPRIRALYAAACAHVGNAPVRMSLDLDPVNML